MFGLILKIGLIVAVFSIQNTCTAQQVQPVNQTQTAVIESKPKNETKMENPETKNLPVLEASINLNDKTLNVEYKVKNTTDKAIYLFNVFWEMNNEGKAFPAKDQLYVCLRKDKTLLLAKQIPKLPMIDSVEFRQIPYVTKVDAGKEFSEKISLPVPVEEFSPYFLKTPDSTTELRNSENVIFKIQFISDTEGLEIKETAIDSAFKVWHQNLLGNVENLETRPKNISIEVNKRTDKFEEF